MRMLFSGVIDLSALQRFTSLETSHGFYNGQVKCHLVGEWIVCLDFMTILQAHVGMWCIRTVRLLTGSKGVTGLCEMSPMSVSKVMHYHELCFCHI